MFVYIFFFEIWAFTLFCKKKIHKYVFCFLISTFIYLDFLLYFWGFYYTFINSHPTHFYFYFCWGKHSF